MKNNESGNNENRARKVINRLFAHASMLFSILVIVCFVIDKFNDAMDFMTSDISKGVFAVTAVISIVSSILTIINLWEKPKAEINDEKD